MSSTIIISFGAEREYSFNVSAEAIQDLTKVLTGVVGTGV